ncbi:MAG: hypothetical protein ACNA8L_06325 [Luteolibacter sp.]
MHFVKAVSTSCLLLLAMATHVYGEERTQPLIPVQVVAWEEMEKHLNAPEIVLVGLLSSFDPNVADDDASPDSRASRQLMHEMLQVRGLGQKEIPGLDGKETFGDHISIVFTETHKEVGEKEVIREAHQQKVKAFYELLGARPYVMSDPTIMLVYQGRLLRAYGQHHGGGNGHWIEALATELLTPEARKTSLMPEIVMMDTLDLRAEKGDAAALAYLSGKFTEIMRQRRDSYRAYSYFWTEAQVRSGAEDPMWASLVYDILFATCLREGDFANAMQVTFNVASTLRASGRFGRLAEVMAVWEQGHKQAGNRMDISSYPDLGPGIPCLPEIRLRDMPVTYPSRHPVAAGSNIGRFHVNDAAAFAEYAALLHSAGRWKEALEYTVWIRNWATDKKRQEPIGEYAIRWYDTTGEIVSALKFMGYQDKALEYVEHGLAAPHGQTYHGRWKIVLAAERLHSLMQLGRPPSDIVGQYEELIGQALVNSHINRSAVWHMKCQLAEILIHAGRIHDGETLYDDLVAEGSLHARRARLTHWIRSGRTAAVEDELLDLLRFSRETGQKMNEYGLYRDYADFLEMTGRTREALMMRREAVRLASIFGLFTHLPLEQSKLAVLLQRLGDASGSAEMANAARAGIRHSGLPDSVIREINTNLAKLQNPLGDSITKQQDKRDVDLQPNLSVVIPVAKHPWNTYLTLANPGEQAKSGHLVIDGASVDWSTNEETGQITIALMKAGSIPTPTQFACTLEPGTYRLIELSAGAETNLQGEIQILWRDEDSSSDARVTLEAAESGVGGAIIQAGEYRANPFYGVPMYFQYVSEDAAADSPPLRFICSHAARVEVYQLDGSPLAIDAQGNGSLLDQGDELFAKSDGAGNLLVPLSNGSATINLLLYPANGIPKEGLTVDIEAWIDGSWQLYSRNRLAK